MPFSPIVIFLPLARLPPPSPTVPLLLPLPGLQLPGSDAHGAVLCVAVADLTFNGVPEIVLGTYGHRIQVYREVVAAEASPDGSGRARGGEYELAWERQFPEPVFGVCTADLDGDGVEELVVCTLHAVHVLRPDLSRMARKVGGVLSLLQDIADLEQQLGMSSATTAAGETRASPSPETGDSVLSARHKPTKTE